MLKFVANKKSWIEIGAQKIILIKRFYLFNTSALMLELLLLYCTVAQFKMSQRTVQYKGVQYACIDWLILALLDSRRSGRILLEQFLNPRYLNLLRVHRVLQQRDLLFLHADLLLDISIDVFKLCFMRCFQVMHFFI